MIHARGLTRDFVVKKQTVHAVKAVDIDVQPGELVAFLGPNGAGKSTTLRMLTTLLPPTSGTATVAGHDIGTEPAAVRRRIGYIGQGNGAGHSYRVRDELVMQGRFYGLSKATAGERADELMVGLDLADLGKRRVQSLSGGQRRRLDVAMGLMNRPPLLFLDEPSTGMDPQNRANLWEHVLRLHAAGTTIVLTTHYLEEADTFAQRVIVIDHGEIIADDTAARLKATLAGDTVSVDVQTADVAVSRTVLGRNGRGLGEHPVGDVVRLTAVVDEGRAALAHVMAELIAEGVLVVGAGSSAPTLDDVFLKLTGRSLREEEATDPTADAPVAKAGA
jgi:ABC-2 type transport system ATP-binding protein